MPIPQMLVIGSINLDLMVRCPRLPTPGETRIARSLREVPGGKGANQAVAAARLGAAVKIVGRVGSDAFAQTLLDNLARERVDIESVLRTADCSSGTAVVAVDDQGENSIVVIPGANGRLTPDDVDAIQSQIAKSQLLLLQLEVPLETVVRAVEVARQVGCPVILNPAPSPDIFPESLWDVEVLCPNQTEASMLIGRSIESVDSAIDAARTLLARGPRQVIITLGRSGAVAVDQKNAGWIRPYAIEAVDTTAAGDAFVAAFALGKCRGDSLLMASHFAAAAGALATSRAGAQSAMPTLDEVEKLMRDQPRSYLTE